MVLKKLKDLNLKEQEQYYKNSFYIISAIFLLFLLFSAYMIYKDYKKYSELKERYEKLQSELDDVEINSQNYDILPKMPRYNIEYSDVSLADKLKIKKILKEINPIYLTKEYTLSFSSNISSKYSELSEQKGFVVTGVTNYREKTIYIDSTQSYKNMEITLCHELLHTFSDMDNDAHRIVYSGGMRGICYKE